MEPLFARGACECLASGILSSVGIHGAFAGAWGLFHHLDTLAHRRMPLAGQLSLSTGLSLACCCIHLLSWGGKCETLAAVENLSKGGPG